MNRLLLAPALVALALAGPAFAGPGKGHGHGGPPHAGIRVGEPHPDGPEWKRAGRHDNGLHLGQRKHWSRGERLPRTYLEPRYYVRDYTVYHLAPPPPGMIWVRPYAEARDFYLVQAATGLISQILGR